MAMGGGLGCPAAAVVSYRQPPYKTGERARAASILPPPSVHNPSPLRSTDCGFWSDCTGMRVILPKPCWSQLGNDTRACGDSEPMIEAVMARMQASSPVE
jgi:hypothetical protein